MSRVKNYLAAYVPEERPKETPKRSSGKNVDRMAEIEEAIRAFNDILAKQNRDNLDAMYNIDMDNMSSSMRRLFQSYDDGITKTQASINLWADETGAKFEAITELYNETTRALAGFRAEVTANYAKTEQFSSFKTEINGNVTNALAKFETYADGKYATTSQLSSFKTEINGNVTNALSEFKTYADGAYASTSQLSAFKSEVLTDVGKSVTESLSGFMSEVDSTYAKTTQFSSFKEEINGDVSSALSAFTTEANKNYARAEQIAQVTDSSGKVTAASIVAQVKDNTSLIQAIADKVDVSGFVTFSSLTNDGESTINGNNIQLVLKGAGDNGSTNITSDNGLGFIYQTSGGAKRDFAKIYTSVAGDDTDETSRYALNLVANRFTNQKGAAAYASLKMEAAGRVSVKGQYGIYLGTFGTYGYITLDAMDNSRLTANRTFSSASNYSPVSSTDYSFNTDGIYYGSKKILGSDGSGGGGTVTAVFG